MDRVRLRSQTERDCPHSHHLSISSPSARLQVAGLGTSYGKACVCAGLGCFGIVLGNFNSTIVGLRSMNICHCTIYPHNLRKNI
jgi:hypothetical protein